MSFLIIKLGATGDVVRTTPLITRLSGDITWVTAAKNAVLIKDLEDNVRCFSWEERERALDTRYDLGINLEDTLDVARFLKTVRYGEIFGAYVDSQNNLRYTDDSARSFDISLISSCGREQADRLKFQNRHTYQDLIFDGLDFHDRWRFERRLGDL